MNKKVSLIDKILLGFLGLFGFFSFAIGGHTILDFFLSLFGIENTYPLSYIILIVLVGIGLTLYDKYRDKE